MIDNPLHSLQLDRSVYEILQREIEKLKADDDLEVNLLRDGWCRVPERSVLYHLPLNPSQRAWLQDVCAHDHKVMYGRILFEKEEDALAFKFTCL